MNELIQLILSSWAYFWLAVLVITLLLEVVSVGLTSIWLSGGALAALVLAFLDVNPIIQWIVFFVVTFVLIYFTRPWAMKYLETKKTATNYEETIGKIVRIVEPVDNTKGTGRALYNGMEWSAKAASDDLLFAADEQAKVVEVRGVKLIVEKL